jgi:hypothetical protein
MADESESDDSSYEEGDPLLGDKANIRKTFVRHIVEKISLGFPGRDFEDLAILELGAGAGFFAKSYREVFPGDDQLQNLVQTDTNPREPGVVMLDVSELAARSDLAERLGDRHFDVVLSIDFLSCLSFGTGLDEHDDVDELQLFNEGLRHVLKPDGAYYDFMVCVPNSQFVARYIPNYCSEHPHRFISLLDPDDAAGVGDSSGEAGPLMFVTFDAGLLRHVEAAGGAAAGPLLHVTGRDDTPFTYDALCEYLDLQEHQLEAGDESLPEVQAFSRKVLDYLFRDINDGGCPDNWELFSYVSVDPAHFNEVFEDAGEDMLPVFLETFQRSVQFLRDTFKGKREGYEEVTLVDAFRATVATRLTLLDVESTEVDVSGSGGDCYAQTYYYAQVDEGDANGEGSFRCLMTKAVTARAVTSAATPPPAPVS